MWCKNLEILQNFCRFFIFFTQVWDFSAQNRWFREFSSLKQLSPGTRIYFFTHKYWVFFLCFSYVFMFAEKKQIKKRTNEETMMKHIMRFSWSQIRKIRKIRKIDFPLKRPGGGCWGGLWASSVGPGDGATPPGGPGVPRSSVKCVKWGFWGFGQHRKTGFYNHRRLVVEVSLTL